MNRLSKTLVLLVGLCTLVISALSVQAQPETKFLSPLERAREAGLGAEIGETQTVDDLSVTLDYAYADSHGVTLLVSADSTHGEVEFSPAWKIHLIDQDGRDLENYSQSVRLISLLYPDSPLTFEYRVNFPASYTLLASRPDELAFTFSLRVNDDPVTAVVDPERTAEAAQVSPESTRESVSDYAYEFKFTVPFYEAVRKDIDDTQTVNGTAINLTYVSVSPISTILVLCTSLPNNALWDTRASQLEIDEQRVEANIPIHLPPGRECLSHEVMLYAGREPQQLEFEIGALGENLRATERLTGKHFSLN